MDFYRFSISWPRILPTGDITNINEKGIDYYNRIIDNLLKQNVQPMITMCHADLPQQLQLFGGFTNSIIIGYFTVYAWLLFERFGDRVKYWIPFNDGKFRSTWHESTRSRRLSLRNEPSHSIKTISNAYDTHVRWLRANRMANLLHF